MNRSVIVIAISLAAVPLIGRAQTKKADKPHGSAVPRTVDGHPDLQGFWTTQTFTPLQRPKRYAAREFLTEQENAELTKLVTQDGVDPLAGDVLSIDDDKRAERVQQSDITHYDNAMW